MKMNIQRFAGDSWIIDVVLSDYKYNSKGELTQIKVRINSNYNIGSIYDIDTEGSESWAYGSWESHSAATTPCYDDDAPYIERVFTNLNNISGVHITTYDLSSGNNRYITYNFKMSNEEPATTTYLTKTSATAVLKGNVVNNLATYDWNNAPSVGAVRNYLESSAVLHQSDIENIVSQAVSATLLAGHPIGSIEVNVSGDNPGTYLGGTWESFGAGRVLMGVGTGTDVNNTSQTFSSAEATGGEYTHKLTVTEMPSHKHQIKTNNDDWNNTQSGGNYGTTKDGTTAWYNNNWYTENAGGNGYHNNIQPYITVYFWKRIS